ncbi:MAG: diguanylate cyclase [Burkholderiales bacterium]|nr:diguanylate cyclase [Burkholderiales bacterium]
MEILNRILGQLDSVRLPLYAVTVSAIPRAHTPTLLTLHWHGFRRERPVLPGLPPPPPQAVPGSMLQINEDWKDVGTIERALLDAAWQLGAWDLQCEEHRPCNYPGAKSQEALACRQAFGDYTSHVQDGTHLIADAPDREGLMQFAASKGFLRWTFRPVRGGLWQATRDDDTLAEDGHRAPPCPIAALTPLQGGKLRRTVYQLGRVNNLILP